MGKISFLLVWVLVCGVICQASSSNKKVNAIYGGAVVQWSSISSANHINYAIDECLDPNWRAYNHGCAWCARRNHAGEWIQATVEEGIGMIESPLSILFIVLME